MVEQNRNAGLRADGSAKGLGFYGQIPRPDGATSTELSIGVPIGGREMEIPSLVPGLTREQIDSLMSNGPMTDAIIRQAIISAQPRVAAGRSPFAGPNEQQPLPAWTDTELRRIR